MSTYQLVAELIDGPRGDQTAFVEHVKVAGDTAGEGGFCPTNSTVSPAARSRMMTSPSRRALLDLPYS
jgi:hypothetical protein